MRRLQEKRERTAVEIKEICECLADRYPQWAGEIVRLDLCETSTGRVTDNDGRTIYYNGRLFNDCTDESKKFYLARQILHLKFGHYVRGKGRSRGVWRAAADAVVDCMLKEDGFQVPDKVFLMPEASGKSAEEYYGILLGRMTDGDDGLSSDEEQSDAGKNKNKKNSGKEQKGRIREIEDSGLASVIAGLAEMLEPSMQQDFDWFPGSTIKDGVLRDEFRAYPVSYAEVLLDTSASVDAGLLRTFVKGVKGLLGEDTVLRVGCFDTRFYGYRDIRTEDDINALELSGAGGTDFTVAVNAFTGDAENRIIFTDGYAEMPEERVDAIWVVYGTNSIHPKGGRVIYVKPEEEKEKHEIDFLIT